MPAEQIRYRLTVLQRLLPMLPTIVIVMSSQVVFRLEGDPTGPLLVSAVVLCGVLPLLGLITSWSLGITLTPSAAVVHAFRRRTVPWSDVQAIRIEPLLGSRTVVIYEAGGRCTRLRAPSTGILSWDRDFEEKFHTIGRWWLDHRGPDWIPVPPPWTPWSGPPERQGSRIPGA
ncbi:hypothetical protein [Streptomyces sp. NPDC047061]|uniref:hypothetical protein n=1 Tax=Streptomyces sp. NPDC047061 TaxID=3154605 RepID=UPI0033D56809